MSGGAILEDGDGIELVQKYDSKSGEWTEVAGMLIPRSGSAACLLGGYIYVIGKTRYLLPNFRRFSFLTSPSKTLRFVDPIYKFLSLNATVSSLDKRHFPTICSFYLTLLLTLRMLLSSQVKNEEF